MIFKLNINMDNAAFSESECQEVARILRALADRVETVDYSIQELDATFVRDYNGNNCGVVRVE